MSLRFFLPAMTILIVLTGCDRSREEARAHSVEGVRDLCSSCHGVDGRSVPPEFPILAGQQSEYLAAQIKSFRDHSRSDPYPPTHMRAMATYIDDATIGAVARYYAGQSPVSGKPARPEAAAAGKEIVEFGIASRSVPACSGCHGAQSEGQGAIPRLAGQHSVYLTEQLTRFRSNARANETMHHNVLNLTDAEIAALSEYFQSL